MSDIDLSKLLTIPAALLAACLAVVVLLWFLVTPASDDTLALRFKKQRTQMERLVSLMRSNRSYSFVQRHSQTPHVVLITDEAGRSRPASEVGPAAVELRKLFKAVGCDYISRHGSEVTIAPPRKGIEDIYPGGYKVFAFCPTQPAFVVKSIDEARRRYPGTYGFYRHLEGPWYIKYEQAH